MTIGSVFITGATGKLGRVIVRDLSAKGWHVVASTRSELNARDVFSDLIERENNAISFVEVDLLAKDATKIMLAQLELKELTVTHLVNNARSIDSLDLLPDGTASREKFIEEFDLDVVQPYRLTMELANSARHKLRTVVNIGSQYGEVAPTPALYEGDLKGSPIQYGVSKAGLHHLTRELAVRLAPRVRVNCAAFGGFAGRTDEDFRDRYSRLCPNQRMLDDSEFAGPVAFLLSDASSSVNGHVLMCDGGWSVW